MLHSINNITYGDTRRLPMKTYNYKKMITLSTLLAILASSNLVPINVLAEESVKQSIQEATDAKGASYSLSPNGMAEALQITGSNALVLNLYAKGILIQPRLDFKDMQFKDPQEKQNVENMNKNMDQAKKNAQSWLEQEQPALIKTVQNVADYSKQFTLYANELEKAVSQKVGIDKETFKEVLQILIKKTEDKQEKVAEQVQRLSDFKNKLVDDNGHFHTNAESVIDWLRANNGQVDNFKKELDQLKENKEAFIAQNHLFVGGGVGLALAGGVAIAGAGGLAILFTLGAATPIVIGVGILGGVALGLGMTGAAYGAFFINPEIDRTNRAIEKITTDMNTAKANVKILGDVSDTLKDVEKMTDNALESLEGLRKQYMNMEGNLKNIYNDVDDLSDMDIKILLKDKIELAKKDHDDLSKATSKAIADLSYIPDTLSKLTVNSK